MYHVLTLAYRMFTVYIYIHTYIYTYTRVHYNPLAAYVKALGISQSNTALDDRRKANRSAIIDVKHVDD